MSFALLPVAGVLLGAALLALGLWFAQRLRVQHRQVEVLSTLFWQAALEDTRARVFVKRFRHWPAWLLLVAIATLLWMLLAHPTAAPFDQTQHVVLLDWSVDDAETRSSDLELAIARASTLPAASREIIAVGDQLETLVAAGESLEYATLRAADDMEPAAEGIAWAVESLASRASSTQPLALHIIGDAQIEDANFKALPAGVSIDRVRRASGQDSVQLMTLGVADSASGEWDTVDVLIGLTNEEDFDISKLKITVDDTPVTTPLQRVSKSEFQLSDVRANGGILRVDNQDQELGCLTLPTREPISVSFEAEVPETLRELISLDAACEIVEGGADVIVGSSVNANLRLSNNDEPAFFIESDADDPNQALGQLIDTLALKQIDATAIADQSGQVVDVQVSAADRRSIAIWGQLFTSSFDFQESRACPILIARSLRWLANQPPMIPWAQRGQRLPVAAPEFDRSTDSVVVASDGREVRTTRLAQPIVSAANIADAPAGSMFSSVSLFTWLGLLVSALLTCEWIMYQRGRMP